MLIFDVIMIIESKIDGSEWIAGFLFFDNHLNFNRFLDSAGPTVNNKKDTSINLSPVQSQLFLLSYLNRLN